MKAVLQRVLRASVTVDGELVSEIDSGLLIFLGVFENDTKKDVDVLARKAAALRIFSDENGKMNLSVSDVVGSVLVVSQFTLCADCKKGRRPNFISAAAPEMARLLYDDFAKRLEDEGVKDVKKGVFGADMKIDLLNDGPVTILLDSGELKNDKN